MCYVKMRLPLETSSEHGDAGIARGSARVFIHGSLARDVLKTSEWTLNQRKRPSRSRHPPLTITIPEGTLNQHRLGVAVGGPQKQPSPASKCVQEDTKSARWNLSSSSPPSSSSSSPSSACVPSRPPSTHRAYTRARARSRTHRHTQAHIHRHTHTRTYANTHTKATYYV